MPFVSQAQRRACWTQYHHAKKQGKTPAWDCEEWERATKKKKLPEKVSQSRSRKRSFKKSRKRKSRKRSTYRKAWKTRK